MAKGVYNDTYFKNHPEEKDKDAVLYCVVLVDKKTQERECLKIGIAKGVNWKDVIRRSSGFKHYDIRIQKVVHGTLHDIYLLEQELHEKWKHLKKKPKHVFGGHTECFEIEKSIIESI